MLKVAFKERRKRINEVRARLRQLIRTCAFLNRHDFRCEIASMKWIHMSELLTILGMVTIVPISVVLLQKFGRSTDEVPDRHYITCSRCGNKILPVTGCQFCESGS